MSLVMLPKARPSATEAALYQQYPDWFHAQYRQLDHFLELTANTPDTVLAIPLPRLTHVGHGQELAHTGSGFLFQCQQQPGASTSTSARYTRNELLSQLRTRLDSHLTSVLAEREKLVSAKLVCGDSSWRWKREKEELQAANGSPNIQSQYQLSQVTARANIVYECLARGVVHNKGIADALGSCSSASARLYKVGLYNSLLLTTLQEQGQGAGRVGRPAANPPAAS